jgi:hypothetical protein
MNALFSIALIGVALTGVRSFWRSDREGAIVFLIAVAVWLAIIASAIANPLDTNSAVQHWFDQHQTPSHAKRERETTHGFAKCLGIMRGDPDAMLKCATQTLDAWGVPRK